jgi:ComF family protein
LKLIEEEKNFSDFILIPIPLEKKKLKWRGFNQSEEIGKKLAENLKIPIFSNVLFKIKETRPQVELSEKERRENIRGCFLVKNKDLIKNKKILLLDDVFTTGSTMEEAAKTLKEAGAKEIVGIVLARAEPGEDKVEEI